jgi:elongation of very long chain fatty acids protein 6
MDIHRLVQDPSGVQHRWVFEFELIFFDSNKFSSIQRWMSDWWWISLPYALFYIVSVLLGQSWMEKQQKKFELRQLLVSWNALLAIFSFWGTCRCVPELFHALNQHGFMYSICDMTYRQGITGLWSVFTCHTILNHIFYLVRTRVWLFMASKVPETIDTLFIVLRRQQLIFLHWYHHASVLVYCFYR